MCISNMVRRSKAKIGEKKMKNKVLSILIIMSVATSLVGCTQADKVSQNLSQEADNFNVARRLTVVNCIEGDVLFQMTGRLSIQPDRDDDQLEIIVENDDRTYTKHFIGLSDNVSYVVEDLGSKSVNKYKYELNFNPKMWNPLPDAVSID